MPRPWTSAATSTALAAPSLSADRRAPVSRGDADAEDPATPNIEPQPIDSFREDVPSGVTAVLTHACQAARGPFSNPGRDRPGPGPLRADDRKPGSRKRTNRLPARSPSLPRRHAAAGPAWRQTRQAHRRLPKAGPNAATITARTHRARTFLDSNILQSVGKAACFARHDERQSKLLCLRFLSIRLCIPDN